MHAIRNFAAWLVSVLIAFAAALPAIWIPAQPYYSLINKPGWAPDGAVFGPVWAALYIIMATAAWLVWKLGRGHQQRRALRLYAFQLLLNAAWTPLFFGLRAPGFAFAEIVLLWFVIGATLEAFHDLHHVAGWLFVPYLAWVTFAAALNFKIWVLNP